MNLKKVFLNTLLVLIFSASMTNAQVLNLKIMSYNIQQPNGTNWDGRKASLVAVINNENPDVLGSQEAVNYQRDYINANISGYSWYGQGRDGGDAGEGSFIFYKTAKYTLDATNSGNMWLSNTPTVPSRLSGSYNRICSYVRLTDKNTNKSFYLFNIHNYMPSEYDNRLAAAKMLVQKVASRAFINDPVYITGDFNSSEGDGVTVWMKSGTDNSIKFRDTYRDIDPSGSVTTGFGTKFDYIYCPNTSNYTTVSSHVVTTATSSSDHLPIIANVSYGEPVAVLHAIPGTIQAEAYSTMNGVLLENTTDIGGGQNVGFLNPGDWLVYNTNVAITKTYELNFRIASATTAGIIDILVDNVLIKSKTFTVTGGWQAWQNSSTTLDLSSGVHEIKLLIKTGDFNINWIEFKEQQSQLGFQVKAVSMNLWRRNSSWPTRINNVVTMINNQAPDIVGIQEGDEGKSPELDNLLTNYTLEKGPWSEESTSILYNHNNLTLIEAGVFGYSSTPDINKSSDWGDGAVYGWLRKCNWVVLEQKTTGKRFYVYNNHLDANGLSSNPAYWRSKETELMATRIANRLHPEYPFIVIGDLNGNEQDAAIIYLKTGAGNPVPMKDTYREFLPNGAGDTFGSGKYDYILVANTSDATTTAANIIYPSQYGQLSDHNGIYSIINFGGGIINQNPSTTLSSPLTGSKICIGAALTLNAIATDNDGTINKVDFYNGPILLGSDNTAPYSLNYTPISTTNLLITAVAIDNLGATGTSAAATVSVNPLPIATISNTTTTTFCQGGNVILTASSGSSYLWRKGGILQTETTQTLSATTSGAYTVEVTDANACKAASSAQSVSVQLPTTWYADSDNDGKGNINDTKVACTQPIGYVASSGDNCPTDPNKLVPGNCGCGNTENSCLDCFGTPNGSGFLDQCQQCVGGLTQKEACTQDCNGDWGGTAFIDSCGKCAGGNTGLVAITDKFKCTTSIEDGLDQKVVVQPNPFTDNLKIIVSENVSYKLIDLHGKIIANGNSSDDLNTQHLSKGVYILLLIQGEKTQFKRLIKE